MSRLVRVLTASVAVLVLQGATGTPLSAQFGALGKKVKKAAGEAVEQQLPFTPQAAPEFSDRVLEITAARLDQLLLGFNAEVAHAKTAKQEYEEQLKGAEAANNAYEAARAEHEKKRAAYQTCADGFRATELKAAMANEAAMDKVLAEMNTEEFERYIEDLALRGEAFAKRTMAGTLDPATDLGWQAYARETAALQREQTRRMKEVVAGMNAGRERDRTANPRLVAACGPEPKAPINPAEQLRGPESVLLRYGADAAALDGNDPSPAARLERYSIMRERVINWMAEKGRPSRMGFSAEEVSVLQAAAQKLSEVEKNLKKAGVPV